jgi:hypothetical protein
MSYPLRQIPSSPNSLASTTQEPPLKSPKVQAVARKALSFSPPGKSGDFLEFLVCKYPVSQKFSEIGMLTNFLQKQGLDKTFVDFFKEGTQDVLPSLLSHSRIFFFKNFVFFTKREGAISLFELQEFCQIIKPHIHFRDFRKINKILFFFLEKKRECWPYLDESLHLLRSHSKCFNLLVNMCELLPMLPLEQWVEFADFYKNYAEEVPLKSFAIFNFFKTFSKEQRNLLLHGSNTALRKYIFRNEYDLEDSAGIEILLTYTPQEIEHFYTLMSRLREPVFPNIFLIPNVFDLKGLRKQHFFIKDFEHALLSMQLNLENLFFTLEFGAQLHTIQLPLIRNTINLLFLDRCFGKETALINFLYENFLFFLNPVIQRIIHGDLMYLLDIIDQSLTLKTAAESDFVRQRIQAIQQTIESLPSRPQDIICNTPAFDYFERFGFLLDVHSGSIIVKREEMLLYPDYMLEMLIESQLIYFNDLNIYFIEGAPKIQNGVFAYSIPPTIDDGGPRREFFFLLLKSLFASKNPWSLKKDDEGYLILEEDHTPQSATHLRNFGLLLSRLQILQIPTGHLLPLKSFELLQFFKKNQKMPKDPFFKNIDQILNGTRLLNQKNWSEDDLEQIQQFLALDSIDEVPSQVLQVLYNSHEKRARALWEIFQSFTNEQRFEFQSASRETLQHFFEGEGIRGEILDQFLIFTSSHSSEISEEFKKRAKIWFEKGKKWQIESLTQVITGAPNLFSGQKITFNFCKKEENSSINPLVESFIHTCNSSIDIFMDDPDRLDTLLDEISTEQGFNAI